MNKYKVILVEKHTGKEVFGRDMLRGRNSAKINNKLRATGVLARPNIPERYHFMGIAL